MVRAWGHWVSPFPLPPSGFHTKYSWPNMLTALSATENPTQSWFLIMRRTVSTFHWIPWQVSFRFPHTMQEVRCGGGSSLDPSPPYIQNTWIGGLAQYSITQVTAFCLSWAALHGPLLLLDYMFPIFPKHVPGCSKVGPLLLTSTSIKVHGAVSSLVKVMNGCLAFFSPLHLNHVLVCFHFRSVLTHSALQRVIPKWVKFTMKKHNS